jgi:hypothetical protein
LSRMLSSMMPPFIFNGLTIKFYPLQGRYLIIPVILMPLTGGLSVLFQKRPWLIGVIFAVTSMGLMSVYVYTSVHGVLYHAVNLFVMLMIMVMSWGFHMAALYYRNMKSSLC